MTRELSRIGEKARENPKEKFTSIFHFVTDLGNLRASYEKLEKGKAPGIDGVSKEEYGEKLEENLKRLSERLSRMEYRPQPVKRKYIPKAGSKKKRPLGIPCFEDKLVQMALTRVLEQIYEADFQESSYGYRPKRTQHQALDELGRRIQQRRISYVVEADIKGFFDHVNHEWLLRMLEERIGDERVLRLINRMLKGGVMEDGLATASDDGVPQGGVLSPLLSNVYLHYTLDLWFARRFQPGCKGEAYYFRYADDFLGCFQYRQEAMKFLAEIEERLEKFHLEIEPSKTKLIEFGRFAEENAKNRGGKPETFDFLGFTHYCSKTRAGSFKVKRMTSKKKFRAKLNETKQWLERERSRMKKGALLQKAKQKLEGHLNYYAITDNSRMCQNFRYQYGKLLFKWLNRQSQRRTYTWEQFNSALDWLDWPTVIVRHKLDPFRRSRV